MRRDFKADYFAAQLKKARIFRGYKTQSEIFNLLGISRQVWSLWELGKRLPDLNQLVILSNFLQLEISYFFLEGVEPGEYANQLTCID